MIEVWEIKLRKSPTKQEKKRYKVGENKVRIILGKYNVWKIKITEWEEMDEVNYLRIMETKTWVFTLKGLTECSACWLTKQHIKVHYGEVSNIRNKGKILKAFGYGAYKGLGITNIGK